MTGTALPKIRTKIPGPGSRRLAKKLLRYECPNVTAVSEDTPIFWERAKGANVWDVDANLYVDLVAGFGVANVGHGNANVVRALRQQAAKLPHAMGDVYPSQNKVELLETLAKICPKPLERALLASSGSEAVEIAMKTALLATGKPGLIVFEGAYHGLSYGALRATSMLDFREPFKSQLDSHRFVVPFPISYPKIIPEEKALGQIQILLREKPIGAILIEPIQGRGGIRIAPASFLRSLRKICDENKILLMADEIYSGFGRTGKWFAFEHSGIVPDIVTVAKGLSGGFPISACLGTREAMAAWPRHHGEALHTSTFLGNPMGCAMALASIREIEGRGLVKQAKILGEKFSRMIQGLKEISPQIGDVRGVGLMIGVEIVKDAKMTTPDREKAQALVTACLKKGLILLSDGIHGNVLSITPPLVITEKQLLYAYEILEKCLRSKTQNTIGRD